MPDWEIAPNGSEGYRAEVIYRCPRLGFTQDLRGTVRNGDIDWRLEGIMISYCPWCGNELFAVFDDIVGLIAEREKGERLVAANNDLIQI